MSAVGQDATGEKNAPADELPGGLMSTENGYTLDLAQTRVDAGENAPLRFRITDSAGRRRRSIRSTTRSSLHLIVVRRDMAGFQHVHPVLDGTGTWSVPVDLSRAGDYRVFADFIPAGGEDLTPRRRPACRRPLRPAAIASRRHDAPRVDGYTVTLSGTPKANEPSMLTLSVSRDGKPVTDLQPYLGAYGHLVALRASDLAYLHVHPMGEPGDGTTAAGPEIGFHTTVPSDGDYRLFLDFKHEAWCGPPNSRCPSGRPTPRAARQHAPSDAGRLPPDTATDPSESAEGERMTYLTDTAGRPRRTADRRHDVRLLRGSNREEAQQDRRRDRDGQLRHGEGPRRLRRRRHGRSELVADVEEAGYTAELPKPEHA